MQRKAVSGVMITLPLILLALFISFSQITDMVFAHSGVVLSAWTFASPTIDGTMDAAEWAYADRQRFTIGETYEGYVYVMNDADNLYLAVEIEDDDFGSHVDIRDVLSFYFDNDHQDVGMEPGDDNLRCRSDIFGAFDFFQWGGGAWGIDAADGGTRDGAYDVSGDGTYNYFEISHPLDSADDAHDFSLTPGDTVGFIMHYYDAGTNVGYWPAGASLSDCPLNWCDIVVAREEVVALYGSTPTIDGKINYIVEWNDASMVRFPTADGTCWVCVKQDASNLYVAFHVADTTYHDLDHCDVYLDTDHNGGENPQTDDLTLVVLRDGRRLERQGDGEGWVYINPPFDWTATVWSQEKGFEAEFSIPYTKVGVTADVDTTLGVKFHYLDHPPGSGGYSWPPGADTSVPNTWTDLRFQIRGDVDLDGDVGLDDLYCVLRAYPLTIENAMAEYGVPPGTDIDGDGYIDLDDLYYVLRNYGA